MTSRTRVRAILLITVALAVTGFQWGPGLYRTLQPQTTLWVHYYEGQWRDIALAQGRGQRVVAVTPAGPAHLLLVADVHGQTGSAMSDLAEQLVVAVRDSVHALGTSDVEVVLMIDDGAHWPWTLPDSRNYTWHFGGEPGAWKLVSYGGPVADAPSSLRERWADARSRTRS